MNTETTSFKTKCGLCDELRPCVLVRTGKTFWCCRECVRIVVGHWSRASKQQPEVFGVAGEPGPA